MTKKPNQHQSANLNLSAFFGRFHAVIFAVIVGGGLAVCVYLLMNILDSSSAPEDYTPPSTNTSFDTQTIERVNQLRPLSERPSAPEIPEGRTSPFTQ